MNASQIKFSIIEQLIHLSDVSTLHKIQDIISDNQEVFLSDQQKQELKRREQLYTQDKTNTLSWNEVVQNARDSRR